MNRGRLQEKNISLGFRLPENWGMPIQSGRIDEKQQAIAARVRMVRFHNQLSQPKFANLLGISLDQAASIEYARTPLTVQIADKLGMTLDINLIWLATGRGRMKPCGGLILKICPETNGNSLLSDAVTPDFEKKSKIQSDADWTVMLTILGGEPTIKKEADAVRFAEYFHNHFDDIYYELPNSAKGRLFTLLIRTLSKFSLDWDLGNRVNPGENISLKLENKKNNLTDTESSDLIGDVKSRLPGLLGRLKDATTAPGKKTELADFLSKATGEKVPLASVSRWLAGEREPGGEIALQMDAWVTKQGFPK